MRRATPDGVTISALSRFVRAISQSHTKSDAEDARMLARLGRADVQGAQKGSGVTLDRVRVVQAEALGLPAE